MSKRYVIQVRQFNYDTDTSELAPQWENVQHPTGGDWLTRSSKTALKDAARLVRDGETRELRIAVSRPVYALTPFAEGTHEHIKLLVQITQDVTDEAAKYGFMQDAIDPGPEHEDYDEDEDEDDAENDESEDVAPAAFEVIDEGTAVTHGDDPTGN